MFRLCDSSSGIRIHDYTTRNDVCNYVYICILFFILSLNVIYLSALPKHVAFIYETNKICCCLHQYVYHNWHDIPQWDELHKNL